MEIILFSFYFILLCFILTKISFVTNLGFTTKKLLFLFSIKVLAGLCFGFICNHYFTTASDYNIYESLSKIETKNLFENPKIFFTDIFYSNYNSAGGVFSTNQSYWNDLSGNVILKTLGLLNLINWGNFYISNLFLNFISFIGCVALYKIFFHIFKANQIPIIIGCFLLPSTLYFSSGVSKEIFVFSGICFFLYALYFSVVNEFKVSRILVLFIAFFLLFIIRNYIAVLLLPFAVIFSACNKMKYNATKGVALFLLFAFISLLAIDYFKIKNSPLNLISNRQDSFISLGKANTDFNYDTLQPTLKSFAMATPKSFRNAFLSPIPNEFKSKITIVYFVEFLSYYLLLFLLFFYYKKNNHDNSFIIFTVVFSFILMMIIGYTITNFGALVRYRSIYLPFFITPILCSIDWQKIKAKFNSQS